MYRLRRRYTPVEESSAGGYIKWYNTSGSLITTTYPADVWISRSEGIRDEIRKRYDNVTRFCMHYKYHETHGRFSFVEPHNGLDRHEFYNVDLHAWIEQQTAMVIPGYPEARAIFDGLLKDAAFNSRAYEAMLPSLAGKVSLTNFLFELTDVKLLLRLFTSSSGILKRISEGHLSWSFGVKPMISDIQEIWSSLFNFEKRIKDFLGRRGEPQKRRYTEESDDGEDTSQTTWGAVSRTARWAYAYRHKRVATMSYVYDCPDIISVADKLRALRDMLGLRLTPSVVWEAIPFSFVVDWVFSVQDFLRSREDNLIVPDVIITDYSISCKLSFFSTATLQMSGFSGTVSNFTGHWYQRRRAIPNTSGEPLTFGGLTTNQLALSFSLLNVRRR